MIQGCYWGALYAEICLIKTPGYFVHQWNVRLKDMIPTQYVNYPFESAIHFSQADSL
jgi:hypothetical protein